MMEFDSKNQEVNSDHRQFMTLVDSDFKLHIHKVKGYLAVFAAKYYELAGKGLFRE